MQQVGENMDKNISYPVWYRNIHVAALFFEPTQDEEVAKSTAKDVAQIIMKILHKRVKGLRIISIDEFIKRTLVKGKISYDIEVNIDRLYTQDMLDKMSDEAKEELRNLNNKAITTISHMYHFLGDTNVDPNVGLVDISYDYTTGKMAFRIGISTVFIDKNYKSLGENFLIDLYVSSLILITRKFDNSGYYMSYSKEDRSEDTFIGVHFGNISDELRKTTRALQILKDNTKISVNEFIMLIEKGILFHFGQMLLNIMESAINNLSSNIKSLRNELINKQLSESDRNKIKILLDAKKAEYDEVVSKRTDLLNFIASCNLNYYLICIGYGEENNQKQEDNK